MSSVQSSNNSYVKMDPAITYNSDRILVRCGDTTEVYSTKWYAVEGTDIVLLKK